MDEQLERQEENEMAPGIIWGLSYLALNTFKFNYSNMDALVTQTRLLNDNPVYGAWLGFRVSG